MGKSKGKRSTSGQRSIRKRHGTAPAAAPKSQIEAASDAKRPPWAELDEAKPATFRKVLGYLQGKVQAQGVSGARPTASYRELFLIEPNLQAVVMESVGRLHAIGYLQPVDVQKKPGIFCIDSGIVAFDPELTVPAQEWPPDAGVHFRPGEFACNRVVMSIQGNPWEVLSALAKAKGPLSPDDFRKTVWKDYNRIEDGTIRSHIFNVRSLLRQAFGLPKTVDPIPAVDHGKRLAWRLNTDVLKPQK